jgi:hypothetical protein
MKRKCKHHGLKKPAPWYEKNTLYSALLLSNEVLSCVYKGKMKNEEWEEKTTEKHGGEDDFRINNSVKLRVLRG